MSKFGGIQDKIKVIKVNKNIIDIQHVNLLELDIKYENHRSKDSFLLIASKLQKWTFLYEPISADVSETILLRSLLYNPALFPIIVSKKNCLNCVYTRTPLRKECLDTELNIISISSEDQIFVSGIAINKTMMGNMKDLIQTSKYIVPEYTDIFEHTKNYYIYYFTNDDNKYILLLLLRQLQYAINFYQSTIGLHVHRMHEYVYKPEPEYINIKSWYSDKEIEHIKFLTQDSRSWLYNLDPSQALTNFDMLLYSMTEGMSSKKVKEYFENREIEKNRNYELQCIKVENIKTMNMARRFIIIIENKLGSDIHKKILFSLSKGKYLRLPGGSMAIPTIVTDINNPVSILNLLTKPQQDIVKIEYEMQERYINSVRSNKCPHVALVRKLIHSKNYIMTKDNFNKLSAYFSKEESGFIICANCGFHIMCKHTYDKIDQQINNISPDIVMTNLLQYAIKIKVNKVNEYYCKYCGEQLIKDLYIEEREFKPKTGIALTESEIEIRDYQWSVIMTALHTASGDIYINERKIAMYISSSIKSFTSNKIENALSDKSKVIIVMYVYAYILHVIKNQHIKFFGIDPYAPTSKIAEKILFSIYGKYRNIINSTKMTIDNIKNEFMEAYKALFNDTNIQIPIDNMEANLAKFVYVIDPIYAFARVICILFKKISFKVDLSPDALRKEFELIIGSSLPNVVKSAKDYVVNKKTADDIDFFYKGTNFNLYEKLVTIDNSDSILNKFMSGQHQYHLIASYIMLCKYVKDVKNIKDYIEYRKIFDEFIKIEKYILLDNLKYSSKPQFSIQYTQNSHFKQKIVLITKLYDENGQRHKWNKYFYNDRHILINVGCSICGIKYDETNKLNVDKTWKSVNALSDINAFYTFYKVRCPVEDLHEWTNDTCTKCNIKMSMLDFVNAGKLDAAVLSYYDKYLSKFIQEKREYKKLDTNIKYDINISNMTTIQYTYNYTYIVKVAEITDTHPNIIESIGLTEGRVYSNIEEGIDIPIVQQNNVYNAYSELIYLLSKVSKVSKVSIAKYLTDYTSIYRSYPFNIVHKYIIQSICEIILQVYTIDNELAINLFKDIIKNQRLFAAPVAFNWNVFDPSDDTGVYLGDDIGDSGEDLIVERLAASKLEMSEVYYSAKNIDYDFTEDNPNNELNIENPNEYIYT